MTRHFLTLCSLWRNIRRKREVGTGTSRAFPRPHYCKFQYYPFATSSMLFLHIFENETLCRFILYFLQDWHNWGDWSRGWDGGLLGWWPEAKYRSCYCSVRFNISIRVSLHSKLSKLIILESFVGLRQMKVLLGWTRQWRSQIPCRKILCNF